MKTIGLIGGMSWESSLEYYRLVNEETKRRLGPLHSARSLMLSVNFAEIEVLQQAGRWDEAGELLARAAQSLERGGADFILLCTNTMHLVARQIEAAVSITLVHIADPTAQAIQSRGFSRVGLLGTRFTMEKDFYKGRLEQKFGLQVSVPASPDREVIHTVIYKELVQGVIREESKHHYLEIIERLRQEGVEGIILGCTEIGLLVKQADTDIPLFDTTHLHAQAAVDLALAD